MTAAPFGIAATLRDAAVLAEHFGPGARLGFGHGDGDILVLSDRRLPAIPAGRDRYMFAFSAEPDAAAPVIEYLARATGTGFMAACCARPWAGRCVYQGHLFVHGRLAGNLVQQFSRALDGGVGLVPRETVAAGALAIRRACGALKDQGRILALIDAVDEADCAAVADALAAMPLTGGGWLAPGGEVAAPPPPAGPLAILSGALDRQTIFQIGAARAALPVFDLDLLHPGPAAALAWAGPRIGSPFIITSSVPPDRLTPGAPAAEILGMIAQGLVQRGVSRLIVAGSKTAGAVIAALGVETLTVGAGFAGLRWLQSATFAIAVKPGGAGGKNLFLSEFGPQIRLNATAE
jgi:uncharacterized protein YgbK (DUF1537 family)